MKMYGVNLAEGSEIVNLSVALGTSYPSNPNAGELFFRTDNPNIGLYIHDGAAWSKVLTGASSGTVTSVAVSGGTTGLTTTGGPVTTNGTITLTGTLGISNGGTGQTTANAAFNALVPAQTGENGKVLVTNGTDTFWSYQTTTLTGDVTGSGMSSFITTLATVNSNVGGFGSATKASTFTVNAKGLVIAAGEVTVTPAFSSITDTPNTLSGYGITDAQALDADLTAIAALTGTAGFLKTNGSGTWTVDTATYLTGNQNITISGDISGSGTTTITGTLATVNSNVGSFGSATQTGTFTVNAKGLITAATNTTITPDFSSITSTPTTLSGYGIADAAPLSHVSDTTVHLTSAQNTLIDAITATSTEINYTVGVTSSIQTQLDAKVAKSGSSMNSTANITFSGGGEVLGLPTTPTSATSATSKAYVDALTSASATWRNPIVDPDLYDIVSAEPGSPVLGTTYITDTAGTWTGSVSVSAGSIVTYLSTGSGWLVIKTLASGDRFLVTGEHGSGVGSTLGAFSISGHTVIHNDLVQYNGGTISSSSSWTLPEGYAGGSPTISQGVTVLDNASNSEHLGHTYLYNATSNVWVEIAGPGAVGAGTGLSYSGNVLSVNLGAGIVQLPSDEVGIDVYSTGGLMTTVNGTTSSTVTNAQLALTEVGTAGTYFSVTTDSKGRVTAGTNPTTLSGFGITDGAVDTTVVHIAGTETITGAKTFSTTVNLSSAGVNTIILSPTGSGSIEVGKTNGTSGTPFIDFHSGSTAVDYDSRIIASGGTGAVGGGALTIRATTTFIADGTLDLAAHKITNVAEPTTATDAATKNYADTVAMAMAIVFG